MNTDFVDKESITADPRDPRLVYAVWDRLVLNAAGTATVTGNTEFTRSTNGGRSWEPVRILFNPGIGNQTIANQIVVGPNGTLYNVAARINNTDNPAPRGLHGHRVALVRQGPHLVRARHREPAGNGRRRRAGRGRARAQR